MCLHLAQLEDLDLSYCSFVSAHSLMSISKLPKLRRLVLRGCRKIGECLAYVALSSRFGFPVLKVTPHPKSVFHMYILMFAIDMGPQVLDVTDTKVGSQEFSSLAGIPTLEEFYLGQYDAFLDYESNYISDLCLLRVRGSTTLKVFLNAKRNKNKGPDSVSLKCIGLGH